MVKKCSKCKELLVEESELCSACGAINKPNNQGKINYELLSSISLLFGCIAIALFSWFGFLFDIWAYLLGGRIGFFSFNSFFLLWAIVGIVLGSISIKKLKNKRAKFGIILNSISVVIHIYVIIFVFVGIYIIG